MVRQARVGVLQIFVIALCVRVLAVAVAHQSPSFAAGLVQPDVRETYRPMALAILENFNPYHGTDRGIFVPPLFPAWLALCYALLGIETPIWAFGLINSVLRAGSVSLVFLLSQRLVGRRAALAAATLMMLDPWEWFWTPYLMKESLSVFLMLVAVVALHRALTGKRDLGTPILASLLVVLAGLAFYGTLILLLLAPRLRLAQRKAGALRWTLRWAAAPLVIFLAVAQSQNWTVPRSAKAISWIIESPLTSLVSSTDTRGYSPGNDTHLRDPPPNLTEEAADALRVWSAMGRGFVRRVMNLLRPAMSGARPTTFLLLGVPYLVLLVFAIVGFRQEPKRLLFCSGGAALITLLLLLNNSGVRQRQYVMPWLYPAAGLIAERVAAKWGKRRAAVG